MCAHDTCICDIIFKKAKALNDVELLAKAKQLRNECTAYSRYLQRSYIYTKLQNNNTSPRQTWKVINSLIKDNPQYCCQLKMNGLLITDETILANTFHEYFITAVRELHTSFIPSTTPLTIFK